MPGVTKVQILTPEELRAREAMALHKKDISLKTLKAAKRMRRERSLSVRSVSVRTRSTSVAGIASRSIVFFKEKK